jgi:GT2 family glycosyltransferase
MLSILITHHRTPVLLKLCLKSIEENIGSVDIAQDRQFEREIIIVDSQAEPETQELIKEKFPAVRFISFSKNIGYAKIVNEGIKAAQGNYILILNADIIVLKEAIIRLLEYLEQHPEVGIVGPQLLTFSNQVQSSCFHFPSLGAIIARRTFLGRLNWGKQKIKQFLIQEEDFSSPQPVNWLQGSAMLVRRKAIEKVGLLDERFFMYLEDTDWCRRFWQNGYQVVCYPTAQMAHYYYRASKKWGGFLDVLLNKYTRLHIISALKYFWKWRRSEDIHFKTAS